MAMEEPYYPHVSYFNHAYPYTNSASGPLEDRMQEIRSTWDQRCAEQAERERVHRVHEAWREENRLRTRRKFLWVLGFRNRGFAKPFADKWPVDDAVPNADDDADDENGEGDSRNSRKKRKSRKSRKDRKKKDRKGKGRASDAVDGSANVDDGDPEHTVVLHASVDSEVYRMLYDLQTEAVDQRKRNDERFDMVRRQMSVVRDRLTVVSDRVEELAKQVRRQHGELLERKSENSGSLHQHEIIAQHVGYLGAMVREIVAHQGWEPALERPRIQVAWRTERRLPLSP